MFDYLCYGWDLECYCIVVAILINIGWLIMMAKEACQGKDLIQIILTSFFVGIFILYIVIMWLCECCTIKGFLLGIWALVGLPALYSQLNVIAIGKFLYKK